LQAVLAIASRLVTTDPSNAGWQRDLSVSYDRLGDVLIAQRRPVDALKSYRESLAIAERLAAADPSNAGWQRDLFVSDVKIGNMLEVQGNLAEALTSYQESVTLADRLAKADPSYEAWQRDLAVGHAKVATVLAEQGSSAGALAAFREGRDIIARLREKSPDDAQLGKRPDRSMPRSRSRSRRTPPRRTWRNLTKRHGNWCIRRNNHGPRCVLLLGSGAEPETARHGRKPPGAVAIHRRNQH
jgi:tetratricopeptide (TPR) repeat protein